MDVYLIVLRIVHVIADAFWVGAGLTASLFLQPTVREVGPAAGPFMTHLAQRKRLPDVMLAAAGLTILAGLLSPLDHAFGVSTTTGGDGVHRSASRRSHAKYP